MKKKKEDERERPKEEPSNLTTVRWMGAWANLSYEKLFLELTNDNAEEIDELRQKLRRGFNDDDKDTSNGTLDKYNSSLSSLNNSSFSFATLKLNLRMITKMAD